MRWGYASALGNVAWEVMEAAADLHARHHFTAACACDGSLLEESLPGGGCRRRVSYGVWEGARGEGYRSTATARGLWGASIAPDAEVADAELAAIHAYLRAIVERSDDPSRHHVNVCSSCRTALACLMHSRRAGGRVMRAGCV